MTNQTTESITNAQLVANLADSIARAHAEMAVIKLASNAADTLPDRDAPLGMACAVASNLLRAIESLNGGRCGFNEHVESALSD
ncbi:MAG: hypothetical protein KME14_26065 [Tildeniella torsiva UHER 1998/13D]|jgi:hypothetical protein|nr:hypothetical protein [Tildeniella torsiva UHER 1998/13D]